MKHFLLIITALFISYLSNSQTPFCGSDWLPADPAVQVLHEQLEQQAFNYFNAHPTATPDAPQAVLTIPVVVHIIHDNGPENISDAQVQQAMTWLNAAYANTGFFNQGSGTEVGIQFCLAQRTPNGDPTNGITRDQNPLTNMTQETQDVALKNINRWNPTQYLNIWLVRDICSTSAGCGVVGYAYRPEYHGTSLDGLVIETQFFGAVQSQMSVAAHEIGHYLGLYHTFQSGCTNNNCLVDGDRICDTPPDQSIAAVPCGQSVNTCSTDAQSGFTTDQPDMTSNFLDYGDISCFHDFTPGQAARMTFYLNGIRHSLLDSKGCLPPCLALAVSAFTPNTTIINPGQTVAFTNNSQNAATYQWSVNGQPFSTATNATYTFAAPGTYTVTLLAQSNNTTLCEAATSQVVLQVVCAAPVASAFTSSATTINAGETISFINNSQNATTYQWLINNTLFSTAINPAYTFTAPGTYTITLFAQSNAAFCNTDTSQGVIQVFCPVVADFTVSTQNPAENEPVILTNTSQNATNFTWTINGVAQPDTITTVTFAEAGTYIIQLTASNGACQSSMVQQVLVQDSCVDRTFQLRYGNGIAGDFTFGVDVAILTDGGMIFIGSKRLPNSNGNSGFYLVKVKPDGTLWWSKTTPFNALAVYCNNIAATPDGGFVLGFTSVTTKKGYIAKFNADGQPEWTRALQDPNTEITDIQVNASQEILVLGQFESSTSSGPFFAKFGATGDLIWAKHFPSLPATNRWDQMAALPDGGLVAKGEQVGTLIQVVRLDAAGNMLWRNRIIMSNILQVDIAVAGDSSIYLCGVGGLLPNVWLVRMNLDGQLLWAKSYLDDQTDIRTHQVIWANDGLTLVGRRAYQGFITRFDGDGTPLWNHSYQPGTEITSSTFNNLISVPGGYCVVGDFTLLGGLTEYDAWLLKTDQLGFAGTCPVVSNRLESNNISLPYSSQSLPVALPLTTTSLEFALANFSIAPTLLCEKACPKYPEICNNNIDDDGDGLFDCLDSDCHCAENTCQPKRNNQWYFGKQAGLDFSTEPPTIKTDGQTTTLGTTATMNDAQGNLLFYTDGYHIFNRFHQVMPQGTNPNPLINQAGVTAIIIPHPANPALYYVIISDQLSACYYALVDMRLDDSKGDVVPTAKFSIFTNKAVFGMAATRSCTFQGYWLAMHDFFNKEMLAFRIDENGLNLTPVISPTGDTETLVTTQMKFSPDGKQLVRVGTDGLVILYSFDLDFTQSGRFSNPQRFAIVDSVLYTIGVEYSPTGQYLYVSSYKESVPQSAVYQFDLKSGDIAAILNSRVEIATALPINAFEYMQLAPNGKILVSNNSSDKIIDVIHQPDAPGLACQYQSSAIVLPAGGEYNSGFSNCISSDFYQPSISFPPEAPDSICTLNVPINYFIKNVNCDVDSIHWSLAGLSGIVTTNYQYANITYLSPGQGQLVVTAFTDCGPVSDTLPITVHNVSNKILNLGPDRTVCDNGVFTFNAGSEFVRYRWQDGSTDSILTTLLPGKYWVDVFDICGNRQTDTVTVSVVPASVLNLGLDRMQCAGAPTVFQRPAFFAKWQWSPATFLSCDTCASVTADPTATTTWTVIAQTSDGCISLDTLRWQIVDTLFRLRDTVVCVGQSIDLYGITLPADTTVQFLRPSPGLGCDTLLTVQISGVEPPVATVQVQVCADQFFNFHGTLLPPDTAAVFYLPAAGCDSVVTVEVTAFPPVLVSLPADTSLAIGASLILNAVASGTGSLSLYWQPNTALSCDDCLQPIANPLDTITYTLLVTDANGCSAQEAITLRIDPDCQLMIPNAFTPNGDGTNDWFYPITFPCIRNIRLWRVVNRWGAVVFERRNFEPNQENLGWDGQGQASDVFVWMAEVEYFDGRVEQRRGEVVLLR